MFVLIQCLLHFIIDAVAHLRALECDTEVSPLLLQHHDTPPSPPRHTSSTSLPNRHRRNTYVTPNPQSDTTTTTAQLPRNARTSTLSPSQHLTDPPLVLLESDHPRSPLRLGGPRTPKIFPSPSNMYPTNFRSNSPSKVFSPLKNIQERDYDTSSPYDSEPVISPHRTVPKLGPVSQASSKPKARVSPQIKARAGGSQFTFSPQTNTNYAHVTSKVAPHVVRSGTPHNNYKTPSQGRWYSL